MGCLQASGSPAEWDAGELVAVFLASEELTGEGAF